MCFNKRRKITFLSFVVAKVTCHAQDCPSEWSAAIMRRSLSRNEGSRNLATKAHIL
uniref:Uncharacterized protein n=1 Tax=Arundo donax TaxID=35708 RepID=A0A0A9EUT9_ARUDO